MEKYNEIKAVLTAVFAGISAKMGWFGWLIVIYGLSMAMDYATGSALAVKQRRWSSYAAREGLWHKLGSIVAVAATALADWVLALMLANLPGISLPFTYTVLLCPLVTVWYIITELGSIVENVGEMGAPVPGFLRRAIAALQDAAEQTGDQLTVDREEKKEE